MKRILIFMTAVCIIFSGLLGAYASNIQQIHDIIDNIKQQDAPEASDDTIKDEQDVGNSLAEVPAFMQQTSIIYKLFSEIADLYVKEHLYEFDREELLEKFLYDMIEKHPELYTVMLNTMLGTMDRYSSFHNKNSGYLSLESSSAGYGIVVQNIDDAIQIISVTKDSEAEMAGLLPGDKIVKLMGFDISGLPSNVASKMLARPYIFVSEKNDNGRYENQNPEIVFTVERDGVLIDFVLKKGVVIQEELSVDFFEEEGVALVTISSFIDELLVEKFNAAISDIKQRGFNKLIVDLRNNGGGSLDIAVEMADVFVEEGDTMCYFNNKALEEPLAVISTLPKTEFESISVLVNRNTASAAELLASILKNKAGAVLVGEKTFGKAIGQSVYTLATGDYITITTYEILDANKENYNGLGLTPELIIDDVECLYEFPKLAVFNHVNYKTITENVYSEACLALEQRLNLMGFLNESRVDGIWDEKTHMGLFIFQTVYFSTPGTGFLDDKTVSIITDIVNSYKSYTYYDDSQLEVALIYHSSLSQAKRLINEKADLAQKQEKLINENKKLLEEREALTENED